jgi:hypothetical protein
MYGKRRSVPAVVPTAETEQDIGFIRHPDTPRNPLIDNKDLACKVSTKQ